MTKRIKKARKTSSLLFFSFLFISVFLPAQEHKVPLYGNDILRASWEKIRKTPPVNRMMAPGDTLTLPFLDDFSYESIYPDVSLWLDSNVFVNRGFPISPFTLGVATFDGVSKTGCPYDTLSTNFVPLLCDSLTSKHIDLSYQPSDSVYFSFYYQPQGRGDEPETGDSLLLQFRSPSQPWTTVWRKEGMALSVGDTSFRLVNIRVDSIFLENGFQFKFKNLGSRQGNVDQWHLDYVYLKDQRTAADTIFEDVAFVYAANPFLGGFHAMPWNQYVNPASMTQKAYNLIRNNFTAVKNTAYEYRVFDQSMAQVGNTFSGSFNIDPFLSSNYSICTTPTPCPSLLQPEVNASPSNFAFPTMSGNTSFTIRHIATANPDIHRMNDTLRYRQIFSNYYAYDDGTAEHAYGLSTIGAQLAYKFTLNTSDTLRAVDMYFHWMPNGLTNPPSNSVTQRAFRLTIWNDQAGQPGNVIYQDSLTTPNYHFEFHNDWGNLANHFYRYPLTTAQVLSGTFYVGWVQYTDDLLNIGFDENYNNSSKIFYNVSGSWLNTTFTGSLMIRPVFGTPAEAAAGEGEIVPGRMLLWPNPASTGITVSFEGNESAEMSITDIGGRVIDTHVISPGATVDISALSPGLYFATIRFSGGFISAARFAVQR